MHRLPLPLRLTATLALAAPSLLSYSLSPSSTLLNQLLAAGVWGLALCLLGRDTRLSAGAVWAPLAMEGALVLGMLIASLGMLPESLAFAALLAFAGAFAHLLASQADDGSPEGPLLQPVLVGLLLAGAASGLISLVQVFMPAWADGNLIAKSGLVGRAVGNLRQPNHLSTVLLWGLIALVPLAQAGRVLWWRLPGALAALLGLLMVWAVVLTASRTGLVGTGLLCLWGLVDRRLAKPVRWALIAAPLVYLVCGLGMSAWAHETQHTFGGEARLGEKDLSASRFGIWSNTWALIRANPWTGVGFGNFNFAWTLTPFPGRPVAFFDHSHNIFLQLLVELGLPLGLLVIGLLLTAVVQAVRRSWAQEGEAGVGARAALMMLLLVGLHSLFEYPLWYLHFLLPTAWALGHALRMPAPTANASTHSKPAPEAVVAWPRWALPGMGALMVAGALFALSQYLPVVRIYAPGDSTRSLQQRISDGQRSLLFSHHADYAAATNTEPPSAAMGAFASTTHVLLDTRLMMAWARALNESGHRDKASYLAARLREFRNPASDAFFAACSEPVADGAAVPFQCEPPPDGLSWRDFKP